MCHSLTHRFTRFTKITRFTRFTKIKKTSIWPYDEPYLKGRSLEVGARRAPRLLVQCIFVNHNKGEEFQRGDAQKTVNKEVA